VIGSLLRKEEEWEVFVRGYYTNGQWEMEKVKQIVIEATNGDFTNIR